MSSQEPRRKLSEITNTSSLRTFKKPSEPELCVVHPEESIMDLDVIDMPFEDGAFDDYQMEYPKEFNLYSSHL
ncbi:uncharacterized protein Eint_071075 [Encephalitozoon intestinalis ATCC 50506]|uniref:Uncharacterized protein n=1 Tax=Encephalitozoon intestinalis (strain ATCC 50506) TaxID=876142 RepID=W8PKI5_ENCIT|nr:uncharacterized protein Eint_071075 [Encephalitozoon intestinalis ATCC 50506]AHL30130.1 hypothetical protein Eint_071075 [Encephalitozoon intestinalis ATCC 50506]UTX45626.1 hypothetical protein GPK93_07g11910 [Encephalitozoon intestinalis]